MALSISCYAIALGFTSVIALLIEIIIHSTSTTAQIVTLDDFAVELGKAFAKVFWFISFSFACLVTALAALAWLGVAAKIRR